MKRMRSLYIVVVIVFISLSGCRKSETICLPYQIYYNGNLAESYTFHDEELQTIQFYNTTTGQNSFNLYCIRDSIGRLKFMDLFYPNGLYNRRVDCYYSPNGLLNKIVILLDVDDNGYPEGVSHTYQLYYNSMQKIDSIAIFDGTPTYLSSYLLEWEGNNVVKILTLSTGSYMTFEYDNYPSFQSSVRKEIFLLYLQPVYLSYNNILVARSYDATDVLTSETFYTYTYENERVVSTSVGNSYEYQCFEIE